MDLNDCIVTGDCIKTVYTCKLTSQLLRHKTTSQTSILFTCASKATVD